MQMISFLIMIDSSGVINEIIWSDPAYVVSTNQSTIFELFDANDKDVFGRIIESVKPGDNMLHCNSTLALKDSSVKIKLCLFPIENQFLVFAADEQFAQDEGCTKDFSEVVHKFMDTIRNYLLNIKFHSDVNARAQFEKIQILNNQLMNTGRLLEKANAQLQVLNKDLNNRLVKDALTGLVSRYQYREEIDITIAHNPGKLGIFTYLDIDDFKSINDTYGHPAGDKFLIEFSQRLLRLPVANTIKLRISGDEFGLFTFGFDIVRPADFEDLWQQIRQHVLSEPVKINNVQIKVSVSAGMAVYGKDTLEIYDLIEYADFAMYHAKKSGKNCCRIFDKFEYEHINY